MISRKTAFILPNLWTVYHASFTKTAGINTIMGLGTWIRNKPAFLERAYQVSYATIKWLRPLIVKLGFKRDSRLTLPVERFSKRLLFDCKMCGQCTLLQYVYP